MNNKDKLNRCLAQLTPTAEQKERMLTNILEHEQGGVIQMKKKSRGLSVVAAIVLICAVTVTAALAANFGLHEKVMDYFGIGEAQGILVEQVTSMPEISVTDNGVTVTVKQCIADSKGVYLIYEVTGLEGAELPEDVSWEWEYDWIIPPTDGVQEYTAEEKILRQDYIDSRAPANWGMDMDYPDALGASEVLEYDGNRLLGMTYNLPSANVIDGTMQFALCNLGYWDWEQEEFVCLVEGEWVFEWDFTYEPAGKIITPDVSLASGGEDSVVTKIAVSPVSCFVAATGESLSGPIYVNFKDGSQSEDLVKSYTSFRDGKLVDEGNEIYDCQMYHRFSAMIDPESVESITIAGITIPMD